jgi:hypothetical protein
MRCARLKLWSISVYRESVVLPPLPGGRVNIPWSVRVMLCSSFSSSSVRVRLRGPATEFRFDMIIAVVVN